MSKGLHNVGAYRKSLQLFDHVIEDTKPLKSDFTLTGLLSQQIASADSVCANIEEGYGRLSRKEYIRFLDYAIASARETQGRYTRLKHWIDPSVLKRRNALLDEIIGILSSTIKTLRSQPAVKEESTEYTV